MALYLLPSILPPTMQVAAESKKRWKPSISESRKSFIDLQKVFNSYENKWARLFYGQNDVKLV